MSLEVESDFDTVRCSIRLEETKLTIKVDVKENETHYFMYPLSDILELLSFHYQKHLEKNEESSKLNQVTNTEK